jgi:hypothetical protein
MKILVLSGGAIGGHYGARLISLQHSFADNTGRHEEKVTCLTRCTTPAGTPGQDPAGYRICLAPGTGASNDNGNPDHDMLLELCFKLVGATRHQRAIAF